MPGFELIGEEELLEITGLFRESGVLFRHGFDKQRRGIFKVREFELAFAKRFGSIDALAVTSGTAALRVALAALGIQPGDEVITQSFTFVATVESLAVTSGTAALRVALAALGIQPGDEVITQSFTFVATVESIIEAGAIPVCTEVDATLNMDPEDLARRISPRTKAIIPVHMLGVPADLERIMEIAVGRGIPVIEDTAWGCGGTLNDRPLGTFGDIGTFSFDFAKTMTTGEGGMLVFRNAEAASRARAWHDHGHENNPTLPRWEDSRSGSGFNYRMNEMQGAVGLAQLKKLDVVVQAQRANRDLLREAVCTLPRVELRAIPRGSHDTADALVFFVADAVTARRCRESLLGAGLGTKILPEAVTWHFAGTWDHMPSLVRAHEGNLATAFPASSALLARSVALPVTVMMDPALPGRVRDALLPALS
jgi:8-amino-3,8-dideoxy-alpha-D-manno-octulosonate transaminase